MKSRSLLLAIMGIVVMGLVGCGGGGGGGAPATSVISGVASKGPVRNARVQAFSITAPNTFTLLKEGTTDATGNYTLDLGTYTGPVKVEVSGGEFKDETSGAFSPMLFTLRAVTANVAIGGNTVAVTGLTEIAVKKIENSSNKFDATTITEANKTVGTFFGVTDIIGTTPADVTIGGGGDQNYGLALASLMQYSLRPGKGVSGAIDDFSKLLSRKLDPANPTNDQVLADAIVANFLADKTTFLANTKQNQSGISGTTTNTAADIKLLTEGTLPAGTRINGLELILNLPPGVTVDAAADGTVDTSSPTSPVKLSGVTALTSATLLPGGAKFTAGTATTPNKLKLVFVFSTGSGFDVGEFATVTCKIAPNSVVTASHFIVSGFKAVTVGTDVNSIGTRLDGITPAVSAAFK